jgi:hypothetical protein
MSTGEWLSSGKLFARGWTLDMVLLARRFLETRHIPLGNGQTRIEFFVEPGLDIKELAAAQEFVNAAKGGK